MVSNTCSVGAVHRETAGFLDEDMTGQLYSRGRLHVLGLQYRATGHITSAPCDQQRLHELGYVAVQMSEHARLPGEFVSGARVGQRRRRGPMWFPEWNVEVGRASCRERECDL